ncbi:hypothetical protein V8E36_004427 [Tilletia maclaganii]
MAAGAGLVQYGSDSDSDRGEVDKEGGQTTKSTSAGLNAAAVSVIPRSVLLNKRGPGLRPPDSASSHPSGSSSAQPPAAKRAKLTADPFGLSAASATKAGSSSSALAARAAVIDSRPASSSLSSIPAAPAVPSASKAAGLPSTTNDEADEQGGIPFGWAQDPDGTLYPVTPQAHEQYAQWQAAQQRAKDAEAAARDTQDPVDGHLSEGGGEGKKGDLPSFSASDLAGSRKPGDPTSSALDAKYAAAAASAAGEGSGEAGAAPRNKGTSFRARNKGQLSALLAIANERRDELDDKHAKGKDRQRDARQRYGF